MAELNRSVGGGASFSGDAIPQGTIPRVPSANSGSPATFEDSHLRTLEVTVPTASLLALRATPYEIVPAPGANKVIEFLGAQLQLIYNSIAYTESGNDNLAFKYTDGSGVQVNETVEVTGFIDQAASEITTARPKLDPIVALSAAANKALVLHNLGSGELAAGNSPLRVKIRYAIHSSV